MITSFFFKIKEKAFLSTESECEETNGNVIMQAAA